MTKSDDWGIPNGYDNEVSGEAYIPLPNGGKRLRDQATDAESLSQRLGPTAGAFIDGNLSDIIDGLDPFEGMTGAIAAYEDQVYGQETNSDD